MLDKQLEPQPSTSGSVPLNTNPQSQTCLNSVTVIAAKLPEDKQLDCLFDIMNVAKDHLRKQTSKDVTSR